MSKISIIIPVYNVEEFLSECLDSVINQTYRNLEIILVNDGSTDLCPQICDAYAERDNRINVIHRQNGGLSDARNAGLKVATGDIISFIDSDDLLSPDIYQIMLRTLILDDADIVECELRKFQTEEKPDIKISHGNKCAENFDTETALELLMTEYLKQTVCNKIYRKKVVKDIIFPLNKINEDEFWTFRVFANAKTIVKLPNDLYFYRQQPKSIMGQQYSLRRLDGLEALEERISYMKENFPKLENTAIKTFCFGCMFHYQQIFINQEIIDPQNIFKRKLYLKVKEHNKWSTVNKWYWKEMIWYKLFLSSPKCYMKFRDLQAAMINRRSK